MSPISTRASCAPRASPRCRATTPSLPSTSARSSWLRSSRLSHRTSGTSNGLFVGGEGVGGDDRVGREGGGGEPGGAIGGGAGAADGDRVVAGEVADVVGGGGKRGGEGGREHDHVGGDGACGVVDGGDGGVGAEVGDAPAEVAQGQAEGDQAELVAFAKHAVQDGAIGARAAPAARHGQHPAFQKGGGEVLLGDRRLAAFPALAEFAQVGQDDVAQHGAGGKDTEQPLQRAVGGAVVKALQRLAQDAQRLVHVAGRHAGIGVQGGGLHAVHQAGGLGGRDAASLVVLHQPQARDVVGGVQAKA